MNLYAQNRKPSIRAPEETELALETFTGSAPYQMAESGQRNNEELLKLLAMHQRPAQAPVRAIQQGLNSLISITSPKLAEAQQANFSEAPRDAQKDAQDILSMSDQLQGRRQALLANAINAINAQRVSTAPDRAAGNRGASGLTPYQEARFVRDIQKDIAPVSELISRFEQVDQLIPGGLEGYDKKVHGEIPGMGTFDSGTGAISQTKLMARGTLGGLKNPITGEEMVKPISPQEHEIRSSVNYLIQKIRNKDFGATLTPSEAKSMAASINNFDTSDAQGKVIALRSMLKILRNAKEASKSPLAVIPGMKEKFEQIQPDKKPATPQSTPPRKQVNGVWYKKVGDYWEEE